MQDVSIHSHTADLLLCVEAQLATYTIILGKLLDDFTISTFILLRVQ